ncbi:MAG: hypothetical protein ACI4T9_13010 [Prevotella sp.]
MFVRKHIVHIISLCFLALLTVVISACTDTLSEDSHQDANRITFTTYVPGAPVTRAAKDDYETEMDAYKAVTSAYDFTIEMFKEGADDAVGSAAYAPISTEEGSDGTLQATGTPLYWPDNVNAYGFKATAGTSTLEADQTTDENWLKQDRLLGYGYEPKWNDDTSKPVDDIDKLNYRTSKDWYATSKSLGLASDADYKKIPLYLKHQRSLITVILKAGEGVRRQDLAFSKAASNIKTTINSYTGSANTLTTIQPLAKATTISYDKDANGAAADNVETTEYNAVVEPHDYSADPDNDNICTINLSGQRFTFQAGNDSRYADASKTDEWKNTYNLPAGKHLVITATIGRESRKILITAYLEDWNDVVTTTIVDDYGQNGDPVQINNRYELYHFLKSSKNKSGTVAIIVPGSINLDSVAWDEPLPLNCTLNMAGATFSTAHQVFSTISTSGNLINGTIKVTNGANVSSMVATSNAGTIDRVNVNVAHTDNEAVTASASSAGVVTTNTGTITNCSSDLPVKGSDMVGGIAATSLYSSETGAAMPIIDACTVSAKVSGTGTGGGIVGKAEGRVTNNTFNYGITLSQNSTNFKNIVHSAGTHELRAYNNAWPTVADNTIGTQNNTNAYATNKYQGVIDSETELAMLLTSTYNKKGNNYQVAGSFTVSKSSWTYGKAIDNRETSSDDHGNGNTLFNLYGNGKTISTDVMLFSNVEGTIQDLMLYVNGNMIAKPDESATDSNAPLAYSVYGPNGKLSNIQVRAANSTRIQAATASGLVVWAYGGATIDNCQVKAIVQPWLNTSTGGDLRRYAGGIVACVAKATVTRCTFHYTNGSLTQNLSKDYTQSVTTKSEDTFEPYDKLYIGGIVGGSPGKTIGGNTEVPSLLFTDCTSWLQTSISQALQGSIIGSAIYRVGAAGTEQNAMASGCAGNWWSTGSRAVGQRIAGYTDEKTVGKCNSVAPKADTDYAKHRSRRR